MRNPIIRYVRNSAGEPIGCVVAIEDDNEQGYAVGWSQCNPADQFRKSVARDLALHRAKYGVRPRVKYGWPHVDFGYPEPAVYTDELMGRVNWINEALYEMHIHAEEKFLGRKRDMAEIQKDVMDLETVGKDLIGQFLAGGDMQSIFTQLGNVLVKHQGLTEEAWKQLSVEYADPDEDQEPS